MLKRSINIKPIIGYTSLFLIYFALQLISVNGTWFDTDELDIMVGGQAIEKGFYLYQDFLSQHMPFSYYLSAFFWKLGFDSVIKQRIAFYLFFAIIWIAIILRYKKYISRNLLILYPFVYLGLINSYDWGTAILSENIAALGFVILVLEICILKDEDNISIGSCIFISLAVIFTFGTIFVACFGVAIAAIGVLSQEIKWLIERKISFLEGLKRILNKYYRLLIAILLPWIIYVIYLWAKGLLKITFYSAYTINREIYPKYNGYGESISGTFMQIVDMFFGIVKGLVNIATLDFLNIVIIISFLCLLYIVCRCIINNEYIKALILLGITMATGTRGYFNYHATQQVAIFSIFIAATLLDICKNKKMKNLIYSAIILVIIEAPLLDGFSNLSKIEIETSKSSLEKTITKMTDDKEPIWNLLLAYNYLAIGSGRAEVCNVGGVPWFWEGFGKNVLERYGDTPPKLAAFNKENSCWGYAITDYAPELCEYIDEHYTQFDDTFLYIRNDYYDSALSELEKGLNIDVSEIEVLPMLCESDTYEQQFIGDGLEVTDVNITFLTYARENNSMINIELVQNDTNETIAFTKINAKDVKDWAVHNAKLNRKILLEKEKCYTLRITASNVLDDLSNCISLASTKNGINDDRYCVYNGQRQDYNIAVNLQ